jgi:hypothetical protein
LALTSPTRGGRSVGILRIQATGLILLVLFFIIIIIIIVIIDGSKTLNLVLTA